MAVSLLALSGCSLLFVAKGGTRTAQGRQAPTPTAQDLTAAIEAPVTVIFKARPHETFDSLSEIFFDDDSQAAQIAKWNHLSRHRKLRKGMRLKIVNPLEEPDPDKIPREAPLVQGTPEPARAKHHSIFAPQAPVSQLAAPVVEVPRPKTNHAFGPGEKLKFEVRALSMLGGYATLEVENYTTVAGRPCMVFTARANSVFPFSAVFPVKDVQSSYFDTENFITWKFENHVNEGGYKANNLEIYDQIHHSFWHQHNQEPPETKPLAPFSQDLISCFYYFRLLPVEVGKTYSIPTQSGGKNYQLIVEVLGRESVTVPAGTFDCLRVKPLVKEDTVFHNTGEINLWVSADERHFPVKIKSSLVIGSIDIDLLEATFPPLNP
jgi:hypothetical protein